MSNRAPFSHPDLALARMLLAELRSFAHPDLENDYHAQRAACRVIDKIREQLNACHHSAGNRGPGSDPKHDEPEIDWNDPL